MPYRTLWTPEPKMTRYRDYTVLQACEWLHSGKVNGRDLSQERVDNLVAWLHYRYNNWIDTHSRYDQAVRNLIMVTLDECG